MDLTIGSRLKHAWNAFLNRDPTYPYVLTSIYNRIAIDVANLSIVHCRLDENDRYMENIDSGLNNCLTLEANIDQTGRSFVQDAVMSMLDEGVVAIVPVDTSFNPTETSSYDILTMRTGKILEWRPDQVKVRLYNDRTGHKQEVWLPKKVVCIVENPLFAIINEPNSTAQRLMRKLSLLDVTDEQTASNKLDLIIQLPYVI